MKQAYSLLEIKAVDEDQWILEGIATTPTPDRVDDVVEPKGAQFTLPVPFLWQHDKQQPIGRVIDAVVTDVGIQVKVQLIKPDQVESEELKQRLLKAWDSIKTGLVRGLSIGFRGLEVADIQGTWGYKFIKWDWYELSAVTIPANQEATITGIKSLCHPEKKPNPSNDKEQSLPCKPPVSTTPAAPVPKVGGVKLFDTPKSTGVKLV
ncbi:HK97 family phage prohead protease [Acinetobacter ursingii]|uniref:HK97 family phage prohead protease n=1 Tax=Acinetobacter ursingii TaxID=108980 RepID=UPI0012506484|nr:HK97 family phage prohead protease [Acinetobacter ursingii]MCU4496357.1 HK97 family phage prohead protease [Acinetobacter ursingii]UYF78250.1 HK97 family phage prohead protease [Acinetobacter ursingii]